MKKYARMGQKPLLVVYLANPASLGTGVSLYEQTT
jgi:hypothetical protein